jgi:hypothetical protein
MSEYRVTITPVPGHNEIAYRWCVEQMPGFFGSDSVTVGNGEAHFRRSAVKTAIRCAKRHAKGKPNTDAPVFTVRA